MKDENEIVEQGYNKLVRRFNNKIEELSAQKSTLDKTVQSIQQAREEYARARTQELTERLKEYDRELREMNERQQSLFVEILAYQKAIEEVRRDQGTNGND